MFEKGLGYVLGIFRSGITVASDEGINGAPIGAAELFQRGSRDIWIVLAGLEHHAPVGGGEGAACLRGGGRNVSCRQLPILFLRGKEMRFGRDSLAGDSRTGRDQVVRMRHPENLRKAVASSSTWPTLLELLCSSDVVDELLRLDFRRSNLLSRRDSSL